MPVELGPDLGDDRVERLGIVDRQLREALPIQADPGQTQPVDQSAVAEPPHLGGGTEPDDEQPAKLTLASPTVAEGEHPGPEQGLLGQEQAATPPDEPFRPGKNRFFRLFLAEPFVARID